METPAYGFHMASLCICLDITYKQAAVTLNPIQQSTCLFIQLCIIYAAESNEHQVKQTPSISHHSLPHPTECYFLLRTVKSITVKRAAQISHTVEINMS
jgi:hypothetical protein